MCTPGSPTNLLPLVQYMNVMVGYFDIEHCRDVGTCTCREMYRGGF